MGRNLSISEYRSTIDEHVKKFWYALDPIPGISLVERKKNLELVKTLFEEYEVKQTGVQTLEQGAYDYWTTVIKSKIRSESCRIKTLETTLIKLKELKVQERDHPLPAERGFMTRFTLFELEHFFGYFNIGLTLNNVARGAKFLDRLDINREISDIENGIRKSFA